MFFYWEDSKIFFPEYNPTAEGKSFEAESRLKLCHAKVIQVQVEAEFYAERSSHEKAESCGWNEQDRKKETRTERRKERLPQIDKCGKREKERQLKPLEKIEPERNWREKKDWMVILE